ncbi:MAG: hypothetical protein IJT73_03965 [Selenomonadaceae bacterium]|nr:hypothetical protein [Selenomonadaceae bacterium]
MEKLELLEVNEDKAVYKYFPETETEKFGIVSVNRKTGERKIEKLFEEYGNRYAFHACNELERYISKGNFPVNGGVAWY